MNRNKGIRIWLTEIKYSWIYITFTFLVSMMTTHIFIKRCSRKWSVASWDKLLQCPLDPEFTALSWEESLCVYIIHRMPDTFNVVEEWYPSDYYKSDCSVVFIGPKPVPVIHICCRIFYGIYKQWSTWLCIECKDTLFQRPWSSLEFILFSI